ncbi:hypothetical protein [Aeromonas caviae]|uniref:hypothetical protein n=1 Tax=Aeromonas caviae TaxID=648 RepID=UPI002B2424BD|nr:hypothetical protein [Aeromonas caviae]MEA9426633.1 hypothetical protein [Aeromonas caviae]MEA9431033.1 hypothetical protein [Aeromonas caviae]
MPYLSRPRIQTRYSGKGATSHCTATAEAPRPSVSPSARQPVSPSVRQSVSPSVRQSVSPSAYQPGYIRLHANKNGSLDGSRDEGTLARA